MATNMNKKMKLMLIAAVIMMLLIPMMILGGMVTGSISMHDGIFLILLYLVATK